MSALVDAAKGTRRVTIWDGTNSVLITGAGALKVDTGAGGSSVTPNAPGTVSVGVTSAAAVAANANRKGIILRNVSSNRISLGFDTNAAVLDSGVTLYPLDQFYMGVGELTVGAINAIASAAASSLLVQEYQ